MNKLVKFIKLIARYILIVLNDGFICLPTKNDLILFESFNGKEINDNPYAIYKELLSKKPNFAKSVFFSVKPAEYSRLRQEFPNVRLIKRFTPKWVWYIARAEFWVMNSRMPGWWKKNRRTKYIQTWHGTPLKKLGADISDVEIPGSDTKKYHQEFYEEAARWNYLIAPNLYSQRIFSKAFGFKNQFLNFGYPRNDILYRDNNSRAIKNLKQKILGSSAKKAILYAPTWRDDYYIKPGQYKFDLPFDLRTFFQNVSDDVVLIIRPHYLVKDSINITGFEDRVKVLADTDISKLYLLSDLLITDYSSVMFDYANLKRPMLFYPYDLKHYRDKLRGFYFQYDSAHLPGPLVTKPAEFYAKINQFDKQGEFKDCSDKLNQFYDKFCQWENGTASQRVVDVILKGEKNGK